MWPLTSLIQNKITEEKPVGFNAERKTLNRRFLSTSLLSKLLYSSCHYCSLVNRCRATLHFSPNTHGVVGGAGDHSKNTGNKACGCPRRLPWRTTKSVTFPFSLFRGVHYITPDFIHCMKRRRRLIL